MPATGLDHVALPTADAERLLRFYKALGFGTENEAEWRSGAFPIFSITFGTSRINVHPEALVRRARSDPRFLRGPAAEPGCGDLCVVWEGGIEALLELLRATGTRTVAGPVPRTGGAGPGISVYVRDPDENLLEFISYAAPDVTRWRDAPGAVQATRTDPTGATPAPGIRRLTHLGLCVSDLERSVCFYRDVLGCTEAGRLDLAGEPTATLNGMRDVAVRLVFLERDGWRLELFAFSVPGWVGAKHARPMNQLGLTHLAFRVDDLDACCARIEGTGGRVLSDTRLDLPGPTRVVMALDPDGIRLELLEKPGDPAELPGGAARRLDQPRVARGADS